MTDAEAVAGAMFAIVADPLWMVGRDLAVTRANAAYRRLLSADFERTWRELAPRVLAGRTVTADLRIVVEGVERSFSISGAPAGDSALFAVRDTTDTSRGERE